MAKKKHAEEHVNLERWLISYADFITLLFATFVVLYALSQLDLAKFKDFKISLQKAFSAAPTVLQGESGVLDKSSNDVINSGGQMDNQSIIPPILDQPYTKKEESDFQDVMDNLNTKGLTSFGTFKGTKAQITERGLVISLLGNVFFEPSNANLKKDSYKNLAEIGKLIKDKFPNHLIRVEGHTDSQPISSSIYPSNWELSSARASSIVRYLISSFSIPEDRFSALGYADSRPVASNNTEDGRKQNRRVEIVILRNKLLKTETLTQEFKKDLKQEIEKFKDITKQKEKEYSTTSDAVKNLLKDSGTKGNVIIFDNSNDAYKKDADKILKELKEKEQQAEEEAEARKQAFSQGVRKQFGNKN